MILLCLILIPMLFAPNPSTFRKEKLAWSLDWKVQNKFKFILQKLLSRDETEKPCTSREEASNLPLRPRCLWKRTWLSSTPELMISFDGSIRSSVLQDPQPQNRKWSCFQEKWSCLSGGGSEGGGQYLNGQLINRKTTIRW